MLLCCSPGHDVRTGIFPSAVKGKQTVLLSFIKNKEILQLDTSPGIACIILDIKQSQR